MALVLTTDTNMIIQIPTAFVNTTKGKSQKIRKILYFGVWERKVSECLTSSVDENSLKEYIHRGQEFGRISFDYSDRDTVLGKLSLTAGSYLLNAGMALFGETP